MHTHSNTLIHIHTHVHTQSHILIHTCSHTFVHTLKHTCTHIHTHVYTRTHAHMCAHTCFFYFKGANYMLRAELHPLGLQCLGQDGLPFCLSHHPGLSPITTSWCCVLVCLPDSTMESQGTGTQRSECPSQRCTAKNSKCGREPEVSNWLHFSCPCHACCFYFPLY